jgi:ribosomal RNA assembly protein
MSETIINTKVPFERLGVLLGQEGTTKKLIENCLNVHVKVDSQSGNVSLTLDENAFDPSVLLTARDIITAIARGFSPERALKLREEDFILYVIDLRELVGRSRSNLNRVKGRVIGRRGKIRGVIEELTETDVSVYGHTISIIGGVSRVMAAREAIIMLVRGVEYKNVYQFLQRFRSELKKDKALLWEDVKKGREEVDAKK